MLRAALEILYAGEGRSRNASTIAMEPRVVDLELNQFPGDTKASSHFYSHVYHSFLFSFAKKRQESPRDNMWSRSIDIQHLGQIVPVKSVSQQILYYMIPTYIPSIPVGDQSIAPALLIR
jgi:hypothetical protein